MAINYKDAIVSVNDPANQAVQAKVVSRTIKYALVQSSTLANRLAHRDLRKNAYPPAQLSIKTNRKTFRLEPGDPFRFSYTPYGVSDMVFRVVDIRESNLEKDEILIQAYEDIDYLSSASVVIPEGAYGEAVPVSISIDALTHVKIVEAPYVFGGEGIAIVPLAARETGMERGFALTLSVDGGASYILAATVNRYCPFGTLVADYPATTYPVDRSVGFEIDFTNDDVDEIVTVDTSLLFGTTNLAILGDEIISFRDITPVSGDRYAVGYVYRGRFDTQQSAHSAGETFYFLGASNAAAVADEALLYGATRQFKLVPFTHWGSGLTEDATAVEHTLTGRAVKPYPPANLRANGDGRHALYASGGDIALTWDTRIRQGGAGIGNYETAVYPDGNAWEGYFRVRVYVGVTLKRTVEGIDDDTWTYTNAMNVSDNGAPPATVTLRVSNYHTVNSVEYESGYEEIVVKKV